MLTVVYRTCRPFSLLLKSPRFRPNIQNHEIVLFRISVGYPRNIEKENPLWALPSGAFLSFPGLTSDVLVALKVDMLTSRLQTIRRP